VGFLSKVHVSCFVMSYLVALACDAYQFWRGRSGVLRAVTAGMAVAGFLAHTIFLIVRSRTVGLPPLLASQQDWLLVMAWLGCLLYLSGMLARQYTSTGLFLLPAILLLIAAALVVSDRAGGNLQDLSLRRWGMFHATSLMLGIGSVLGAALAGLMYLFNVQRLRMRSGWLQRLMLPSLESLTSTNRWMVICSVPLLTIGLATGFLLIAWQSPDGNRAAIEWSDPTIVTTIVVWFAMVGVLIRLLTASRRPGRQVALLSLLSGAFLIVAVLGPMLLAGAGRMDTFHSRPRSQSEDVQQAVAPAATSEAAP
jgi:ABC-type uncharacterized transport system permease subunit